MDRSLTLQNLSYHWHNRHVFEKLNYKVKLPAGLVLLLGRNGVGKTTLLRLIAGALRPSEGIVEMRPRPSYMQLVTQEPIMFPHMNNVDNARFFKNTAYWKERFDSDIFDECVEELGISHILSQYGSSGGESRAVEVTRSLATRPEILLMDEPFGRWDVDRRHTAFRFIDRLTVRIGTLCLVASHLPGEAWPHAQGALLLERRGAKRSLSWAPKDKLHKEISTFFGLN
jgi:ABC-type nitrate/sulfonate/bicarbonate transport system ATPase subunit